MKEFLFINQPIHSAFTINYNDELRFFQRMDYVAQERKDPHKGGLYTVPPGDVETPLVGVLGTQATRYRPGDVETSLVGVWLWEPIILHNALAGFSDGEIDNIIQARA